MSENSYTPTTEQVKAAWRYAHENAGWVKFNDSEVVAEFDRWLAAHEAALRAQISAEISDIPGEEYTALRDRYPFPALPTESRGWIEFALTCFDLGLEAAAHLAKGNHND